MTQMSILHAELAAAEAIAVRELGDRPRAVAELEALAAAPAETTLYCQVLARLELGQARLDEGDLDAAQAAFDGGRRSDRGRAARPRHARGWLARTAPCSPSPPATWPGPRTGRRGSTIPSGARWAGPASISPGTTGRGTGGAGAAVPRCCPPRGGLRPAAGARRRRQRRGHEAGVTCGRAGRRRRAAADGRVRGTGGHRAGRAGGVAGAGAVGGPAAAGGGRAASRDHQHQDAWASS